MKGMKRVDDYENEEASRIRLVRLMNQIKEIMKYLRRKETAT